VCLNAFAQSNDVLKQKVTELNLRIGELEKTLRESEPFRHDIKLRESVEKLETSEIYLNQDLAYVKQELSELNAYLRGLEVKDYSEQIDSSIDKKIKDIQKKLSEMEQRYNEAIATIKTTSAAAIDVSKTSAESSNNNFTKFLDIAQTWGIIFTAFSSLLAIGISLFVKSISMKARKLEDVTENLEKNTLPKLNTEILKLKGIKSELYYLNKMADIRENYSTYKIRRKDPLRDHLPYENLLKKSLNKFLSGYVHLEYARENDELDSRDQDSINEMRSNMSYCHSVNGIIAYYNNDLDSAYEQFCIAIQYNNTQIPDRFYNLACVASRLYQTSDLPEYFDVVMANYIKLSRFNGETKVLVSDGDVKGIHIKINKELEERNLEHLIVPIAL